MFGLHWGFVPIALNNYATLGYDVVMMAGLATPVAMAGVTLAIFLKQKQKIKKKSHFLLFFQHFWHHRTGTLWRNFTEEKLFILPHLR